jgi:hypothetical protein
MERLAADAGWVKFLDWYRSFDTLVNQQDRVKLDAEVPEEACAYVLSESRARYYLSNGYVRVRPAGPSDQVLTAVDVLRSYGGGFLEQVIEAGLARIPDES